MKKLFILFLVAIAASLVILACGARDGNNPVGATGGADNGYGITTADTVSVP